MDIVQIVVSGYLGYFLFRKLNLPAPTILGPLFFSAIININGLISCAPPKWLAMILTIGVAISVSQNFELKLKGIISDLLIIAIYTIGLGIVAFFCLYYYGVEPQTAYFSAMPGGGTDLALIALDYEGADPFRIVLYQTVRFFLIVIFYPIILRWILSQAATDNFIGQKMNYPLNMSYAANDATSISVAGVGSAEITPTLAKSRNYGLLALTFILAIIIARLLKLVNFAGCNYIGGMLATIAVGKLSNKIYEAKPKFNRHISNFFKISSCSLLGLQVTRDSLIALSKEWPILIVMNAIIILGGVLLGWVFYRLGKGDLVTCMLETAPGGVLPMAVLAEELQGDVVRVSLFQVFRIILIVMSAPIIMPFILSFIR